jgi:hypothetical protein
MLASEALQINPNARAIIRNPLALPKANSMMPSHQHKAAFFFSSALEHVAESLEAFIESYSSLFFSYRQGLQLCVSHYNVGATNIMG